MLGTTSIYPVIAVKDLVVAREFYEKTLGLTLLQESTAGLLFQSGQSRVFVYYSEFAGTNMATAACWDVTDLAATILELRSNGVDFEHYDLPGTTVTGDIHRFENMESAWFKDPTGNILCLNRAL